MIFFEIIGLLDTIDIPDYIWGTELKGLYQFANALGVVNGILNICFGVLCFFAFKHYCFVYEQLKDDPEIYRLHLEDLQVVDDKKRKIYKKRKALTAATVMVQTGTREKYLKHLRSSWSSRKSNRRTRLSEVNLSGTRSSRKSRRSTQLTDVDLSDTRSSRKSHRETQLPDVNFSNTDLNEDHLDLVRKRSTRTSYDVRLRESTFSGKVQPVIGHRSEDVDVEGQTIQETRKSDRKSLHESRGAPGKFGEPSQIRRRINRKSMNGSDSSSSG